VVLDFGFKVAGYCSDFTRTVFLKKAPPKLARIYIETEKAYRQAFNHIRAGMTGAMGDALGRDVLREANLEEYFIHSLGHSTGLEVHERPNLTPGEEAVLENSMVFSIEPGVYVPKLGGVRIEDLVYLKNGRPHYFVSVPTALKDMII
jgi:Xaa-Pro aminopeptidase